MATNTRAELAIFDCNLGGGGLEEFEPEAQRGAVWLRVPSPAAADVPPWERRVTSPRVRLWPFVVPVALAAAFMGAVVGWLELRSRTEIPRVGPAVVSPGGPERSAATNPPERFAATNLPERFAATTESDRSAALNPPDASAAATAAAEAGTAPSAIVPVSPAAPALAVADAPSVPVRTPTDPAFEQTLAAISRAYRALDAAAVAAVLPGMDPAALTQVFSELKYQTLSFGHCALRPNGAESAVASCDVSLAMAPKAGDAALQRRHEAWTLVLNRSGEAWRIAALTRR